jgi:hypothetical protein
MGLRTGNGGGRGDDTAGRGDFDNMLVIGGSNGMGGAGPGVRRRLPIEGTLFRLPCEEGVLVVLGLR